MRTLLALALLVVEVYLTIGSVFAVLVLSGGWRFVRKDGAPIGRAELWMLVGLTWVAWPIVDRIARETMAEPDDD